MGVSEAQFRTRLVRMAAKWEIHENNISIPGPFPTFRLPLFCMGGSGEVTEVTGRFPLKKALCFPHFRNLPNLPNLF